MSKPASTINDANNSKIKVNQDKTRWMRFDNKTFSTEDNILSNGIKTKGYGYRSVYYTDEADQNKTLFGLGSDKVFFDPEWDIRNTQNLKALEHVGSGKIVLRRLSHIYPANPQLRPKFFPDNDYNEPLKKVQDLSIVPHFLHELGLFPSSEFRSLMFTQDFQPSGLYHAVVNYNGRWETDVVDDFIPVYEQTGKPLWGMDLEQPWQLIILKFWAKRNYVMAKEFKYDQTTKGGYKGVFNSTPFEFVSVFTNSNWKFVNLTIDIKSFLRKHVDKAHKAHIILKTKNSNHVRDSGLISNQACYQLVSLTLDDKARSSSAVKNSSTGTSQISQSQVNKNINPASYIATIRSSNKTYWAGKKSVLDSNFKSLHKETKSQYLQSSKIVDEKTVNDKRSQMFGLDRYFTLDGEDLRNLFSCCYITTRRIGSDFVSGFHKFTIPAKRSKAVYFQFNVPEKTFLDFSIKQLPSNKIAPKGGSKIEVEKQDKEMGSKSSKVERYLRNKYILVKDNNDSDTTKMQQDYEKDYNRLNYEKYEIEYLKGYNTGDAHFLQAVRGRYILRIKSQKCDKDADFCINYCSEKQITFKEYFPTPAEQAKIMKDAMASTIDTVPRINPTKGTESETIAYGNTFEYIGYGYIGARIKKSSNVELLIDVDPETLKKQGYRLKHLYKKETQPFAVIVRKGEATAIVLKKIDENATTVWPPKGIAVFQK